MLLLAPSSFTAQVVPDRQENAGASADVHKAGVEPKNSLTVFGTLTFANNGFYARSFDRHLSLMGLSYCRQLGRDRILSVSYAPEVIPIAVLSQPSIHDFALPRSIPSLTATQYVYGMGANPLGIEVISRSFQRLRPFVSLQGGFLYFSRNIPSVAAAQFNFVAEGRIGIRIRLSDKRTLAVAYDFHHLSNAFEAKDNPGLDSQMIDVGYTFKF